MTRKIEQPQRTIFGWCADGHHADCWKSYVTVTEPKRVRTCECDCPNHGANREA